MPKPLLVNVSGMRRSGVTTACERVMRCLNTQGINTVIVKLCTERQVLAFEDSFVLGMYKGVDVVLFDKHFYTETAARRSLRTEMWMDDSIEPHLSALIIPTDSSSRHYLDLNLVHYGTENHHIVKATGERGKLYAAGAIRHLIMRELSYES